MAESLCALTLHRRPPLPQVLTAMSPDANPTPNSPPQVLTAMNRFLNEDNGLQMAFLDGNQPDRLCAPMAEHIMARGGEVRLNAPVAEMLTNEDGTCAGYLMRDGTTVVADECATPPFYLPPYSPPPCSLPPHSPPPHSPPPCLPQVRERRAVRYLQATTAQGLG